MDNKRVEITREEWLEFEKTKIYRCLMDDLEQLKNMNMQEAMDVSDKTVMPNESIAAFMNRAKGIQIVMDNILAKIENARRDKNMENKKLRD